MHMHSIVPVDTLVTSCSLPTRITGALIGPHTSAIDTADPTLSCIRTVTCITICLQLSTRESDTTCKNLLGSQHSRIHYCVVWTVAISFPCRPHLVLSLALKLARGRGLQNKAMPQHAYKRNALPWLCPCL